MVFPLRGNGKGASYCRPFPLPRQCACPDKRSVSGYNCRTSTQNFNRYSYALNNPLVYTDPDGEKWKWPKFKLRHLIPVFGQLQYIMEMINDNTVELRQNMVDAGVPDFNVGVNSGGNTFHSINGYRVDHNQFGGSNANAVVNNAINEARTNYYANSSGEIRQWNPSWRYKWGQSTNFFAKTSYELADGISVTLQSFVRGPESQHLDGSVVGGWDRMNAFTNTASWALSYVVAPTRVTSFSSGPSSGFIVRNWLDDGIMYLDRGGVTRYGYRYSIKHGQRIHGKEFWWHLFDWR